MHELSVCQALICQVEVIAEEENAAQVVTIHLGIGPLSGVEPKLLEQAFDIARAGSIASNAQLVIHSQPVRVSCQECGQTTDALPARLICGNCGDWHTKVVSGDELLLSQVELIRNHGGKQDDPENILQFGG
ncbi:MAG: hydrogenase maturation nickel metallochaperone HypA [Gammaproteobacteria bacterium]